MENNTLLELAEYLSNNAKQEEDKLKRLAKLEMVAEVYTFIIKKQTKTN